MQEKLYIVGAGPGNGKLWTRQATELVQSAERVLGTMRIAEQHPGCIGLDLPGLLKELERPITGTTAVLVGGDCCFFSLASRIAQEFSHLYEIERINGIGSIPYLSAQIGVSYEDARLISFHGRNNRIVPCVAYNKKIFALTGGTFKVHDLCRELAASGLAGVKVVVGARLSYPDEKIMYGTPAMLKNAVFDELSVMYVENEQAIDPRSPLRDSEFIRSENDTFQVPMTKEDVRWLTLQKLAISPKDILYDIGAGTGSVAVEMARRAFEGIVYAVEQHSGACELIAKNRVKHGAYNVNIVQAKAPEGLERLPQPDAVFIGGSSGEAESLLNVLLEKNPKVRIVANAVTLQSLHRILEAFRKFGPGEVETTCINVAKSKKVGAYDFMTAQNPVYILCRTPFRES
ncbi:MAG TPA: bifunctional cobalt-precorrin-7 (C(5))-methyltransferase/cobalt-precorrin-6B (C(15))-methyltransferase [Planctomycetaceae bacterium]|nr:bifunctional cobalt-precorrin-7 (C(5))-methyltransferase/cobalt-precorrin-6B (C(15))-methyltransferase [Planctomycetaceae bacterium]